MALIGFFSAKGSPGVTTTAMLTAALWPRESLVVDADPDGGDVGLRLTGALGDPLDLSRGLAPLLHDQPDAQAVLDRRQTVVGGLQVITGVSGPDISHDPEASWAGLAACLQELSDTDVMIDLGRLHQDSPHLPLALGTDLLVAVTGLSVPMVVHTRDRLRRLVSTPGCPRTGFTVLAEPAQEAQARGACSAVQRAAPQCHSLGRLAVDPAGAGIFSGTPLPHPERAPLVVSGRRLVKALEEALRAPHTPVQADSATGRSLGGARARYEAAHGTTLVQEEPLVDLRPNGFDSQWRTGRAPGEREALRRAIQRRAHSRKPS